MVQINDKRKLTKQRRKKGQLFLIEAFIALSVLVLLMIAIYQVEFSSTPNYQDDLSEIGFNALDSLNKAGELKPLVFNLQSTDLANSLDDALPENILWRLSVEDETGTTQFTVFWDRSPPASSSIGATDYFLYGYNDALDSYRVIHLELWRIVG